MSPRLARWLPMLAFVLCANAAAEQITIYRCTDDHGAVMLRDTPCAQGQQQAARDMLRPQDPPPGLAPAPAPAPATTSALAVPETRTAVTTPPQPMYQCVTPDGERYTSDTAEGNPRWVPLWVAGYPPRRPRNPLGDRVGAPPAQPSGDAPGPPELPPAVGLARTPGTWIRDRCYRLPQTEACARLRDRRSELRRQYFNAQPSGRDALRPERHAVDARLRNDCGIS